MLNAIEMRSNPIKIILKSWVQGGQEKMAIRNKQGISEFGDTWKSRKNMKSGKNLKFENRGAPKSSRKNETCKKLEISKNRGYPKITKKNHQILEKRDIHKIRWYRGVTKNHAIQKNWDISNQKIRGAQIEIQEMNKLWKN